jgi:hypothetical protein
VHRIARLIEPFGFDAPLLADARGKAFLIADHRPPDNSVGDDAVRNDRQRAERPKDLDERLPHVTAPNGRGRMIALPKRIG